MLVYEDRRLANPQTTTDVVDLRRLRWLQNKEEEEEQEQEEEEEKEEEEEEERREYGFGCSPLAATVKDGLFARDGAAQFEDERCLHAAKETEDT